MTQALQSQKAFTPAKQIIAAQALQHTHDESAAALSFIFDQLSSKNQSPHTHYSEIINLHNQLDAQLDIFRADNHSPSLPLDPSESPGTIFLCTILALEIKNTLKLKQLLACAEADEELQHGLLNAFSWVPYAFTQPLPPHLLASQSAFYRLVGLHIYRKHQIRADTSFEWALTQASSNIQEIALNATGEIGLIELLPHCQRLLNSNSQSVRFAAARACLLLGDGQNAFPQLAQYALKSNSLQAEALSLLAVSLPLNQASQFLSKLAKQTSDKRLLIQMAGELGDPANIPALLRLMQDPTLSRIASFAFCFITGLDLVAENMEADQPDGFEPGPTDNPEDEEVESDPDEDLPWPDQEKLANWWQQYGHLFKPGTRYLAGKEISKQHCLWVLQNGLQAQRKSAALHLKALDPASPLFLLDTPSWRQQTRLNQLIANL